MLPIPPLAPFYLKVLFGIEFEVMEPQWIGCVVWHKDMHVGRLSKESLYVLFLWTCLESATSRSCSSFFCGKSHRVSPLGGLDPGSPLFLTPYIEKGAIAEGKTAPKGDSTGRLGWSAPCHHAGSCYFSQEAESGWKPARSKCQELCWISDRQQGVQQQPLLLVCPCLYGRLNSPQLLGCS